MNPTKCHSMIYLWPSLISITFKDCKRTHSKHESEAGFKEGLSHSQAALCKGAWSAASTRGIRREMTYIALWRRCRLSFHDFPLWHIFQINAANQKQHHHHAWTSQGWRSSTSHYFSFVIMPALSFPISINSSSSLSLNCFQGREEKKRIKIFPLNLIFNIYFFNALWQTEGKCVLYCLDTHTPSGWRRMQRNALPFPLLSHSLYTLSSVLRASKLFCPWQYLLVVTLC